MTDERKTDSDAALKSSTALTVASALLFVIALGLTTMRVYQSHYPGPNIEGNRKMGFCDFYNGIYYPTKAFLNRDNPYGEEVCKSYPISRQVPFFSPLVFTLHSPLAMLPKSLAVVVFYCFLVALMVGLARFCLYVFDIEYRHWLLILIAGCLMLSRPGHNSIFNGYFTLELVVGTVLALHFGKSVPWLSAFGLLIASFKPTYAIPLFLLMVFRGHWKPAISGAIIASAFAVAGLLWISDTQSISEMIGIVKGAQDSHHAFPNVWPVNTWTRVDLLAMIAKWNGWRPSDDVHLAAMIGILLIPCCILAWITTRRAKSEPAKLPILGDGVGGLAGLICLLTVLVSIYHHFYDCLVLCVPLVGIIMAKETIYSSLSKTHRYVLIGLLSVPFWNYLSAKSIIANLGIEGTLFTVVTSLNGVCIFAALLMACFLTIKTVRSSSSMQSQ